MLDTMSGYRENSGEETYPRSFTLGACVLVGKPIFAKESQEWMFSVKRRWMLCRMENTSIPASVKECKGFQGGRKSCTEIHSLDGVGRGWVECSREKKECFIRSFLPSVQPCLENIKALEKNKHKTKHGIKLLPWPVTDSPDILVFFGCCNKLTQTSWLKTTDIYSITVL